MLLAVLFFTLPVLAGEFQAQTFVDLQVPHESDSDDNGIYFFESGILKDCTDDTSLEDVLKVATLKYDVHTSCLNFARKPRR